MKSSSSISRKTTLSKKDLEKQKLIEEKEKEAEVLQQFVETFEKPNTGLKTFVKGTTINGPVGAEQNAKNQIYKPSKLQELEEKMIKEQLIRESQAKQNVLSQNVSKMDKPPKKKKVEKPKSNLELFKEELKMMQEEREGKLKDRSLFKNDGDKGPFKPGFKNQFGKDHSDLSAKTDDFNNKNHTFGSYDNGDPTTTNIYLGNISPKTTENDLMNLFGRYGPLASVKVMWPRTDEERARNRNCGFVAYMNRKDAERAMKFLNGKELDGYDMKLGWGKTVPLPPHPVYIPPKLREQLVPPPPSFLPFNAQPGAGDLEKLPPPGTSLAVLAKQDNFNEILRNSTVKVVAPPDRTLLCLIHRMVEFVVREGPMFEAMIMNRELMNPMFRFLFDNQSPEHVYYRWRLFSVLQGEHHSKWRTESFRMFKDGPLWRPPPVNPFQQGMPDDLIDLSPDRLAADDQTSPKSQHTSARGFKESKEKEKKGMLTDSERELFEDMLRELTPERQKIQEAMIYCIEHADAAEEIVKCIVESLSLFETPLHKKIARLYLISDVLHNCTAKVSNASFYRKGFQAKLIDVFLNMHKCYESIEGRMKAEHFKQRVMSCFKAWEDWALYASEFLIKLQNIFLGLVKLDKSCDKPSDRKLDGLPILLDDDDVDGVPVDDVDGIPIDDAQIKFKVSKWERIAGDAVDGIPIDGKPLVSKWDKLEENEDDEADIDGVPLDQAEDRLDDEASTKQNSPEFEQLKQSLNYLSEDERRKLLREIEVKVLKYQDDLDSGKESRKKGLSSGDQVEEYRIKVLRRYLSSHHSRSDRSERSDRSDRRRSRSRSTSRSQRRRSYSRSPSSSRHYRKSPSRQSSDHRQRSKHRVHSRSPSSSRRSSRRSSSRSPLRSPHRSKKK